MKDKMDVIFINPGDKKQIYQDLSKSYSAIEPPFLIAVIASYLRGKGFSVGIIDSNAQNLSAQETAERIAAINPLLAAIIVYGSQPSASTQNMTDALKICKEVKERALTKVAIGGLHPSALPRQTLEESKADFVIAGEGALSLEGLLTVLKNKGDDFGKVPGLWYFDGQLTRNNPRARRIDDLNETLPMAAWDLLEMDKYRAHNWHCFDDLSQRKPYAAIYTSLGCPYSCDFCCINALFTKPGIRYRAPERVLEEIGFLVNNYGVKNIKIADELFIFNEKHYMTIIDLILEKSYELNIWAYARVDTLEPRNFLKMKKAGIHWLALGIESANPNVRDAVSKRIKPIDFRKTVRRIQDEGIRVIGNFVFGLPEDNLSTMQETLDLALELNCEFVNFYSAMAYPGSKLYDTALRNHWQLPKQWQGFSQHSYETLPLPTKFITAREVLQFRDDAFHKYFASQSYLNMLEKKFGEKVRAHVQEMTHTRLRRRILSNEEVCSGH